MIVVAGGSASRFGGEKLLVEVGDKPLISHSIEAVAGASDIVVVAARPDLVNPIEQLGHEAIVTMGGKTRTDSELAGLMALGREYDLIGIHDAARPLVTPELVETLFEKAEEVGGAVPTLPPPLPLVEKGALRPIPDVVTVQTPQIFRGPGLLAAYVRAAQTSVSAYDTVEVVQRFGDLDVALVPGEPTNLKVTYPEDIEKVKEILEDRARSEAR